MRAHIIKNNIVVNTIEVETLDFIPGLVNADKGGTVGDVWDGQTFTPPAPPEPPALPALKQDAIRAIDAQHEAVLLQLTGNPTQVEQTTWAGKVALAEAIQQGLPLSAAQSGFLAAMGVPTAGHAQYAQAVLTKSAMYWQLVGVADKVRSDCKDRIASATTHDALAQAGVQNRAQLARALAAVSAAAPPAAPTAPTAPTSPADPA